MNKFYAVIFVAISFTSSLLVAEDSRNKLPWDGESGKSYAVGISTGLWGRSFAVDLNTKIPVWQGDWGSMGVRVRGLLMQHGESKGYAGGRLELYSASDVLLNFVRIYGGGGYQLLYPIGKNEMQGTGAAATPIPKALAHGGNGYFGFEFFFKDFVSYNIEIGGTFSGSLTGATIMAGATFYPFTRSQKFLSRLYFAVDRGQANITVAVGKTCDQKF